MIREDSSLVTDRLTVEAGLPPAPGTAWTLADTRLAQLGFVSDQERIALAQVPVSSQSLRAGTDLIREGSSPEDLLLLIDGWACRYMTTRSGARQISVLLVPGSVCNLDNLLLERADCGVRALTQVSVLTVRKTRALALTAEHPGIARAFTWLAIAENAILSQWAVGLGRRSAKGRLAHLLCELSIRVGASDTGESSFLLPLTQELIADTLGLTAVHINRTMQNLRSAGLISTEGRMVKIHNTAGLRALAEFDGSYLSQIEKSGAALLVDAAQSV